MTKTMVDSSKRNGRTRPVPEEPVAAELEKIPLLGPTRIKALAEAGIKSLADLGTATEDQLGAVKGIGLRNAQKIKAWLTENAMEAVNSQAPAAEADIKTEPAAANLRLQDALAELDRAVFQIKSLLPDRPIDKKLIAQLDKVNKTAGDIPEIVAEPSELWEKSLRRLKKVTALVCAAAAHKLSDKNKRLLRDDLRKRRRRLQKALDTQQ